MQSSADLINNDFLLFLNHLCIRNNVDSIPYVVMKFYHCNLIREILKWVTWRKCLANPEVLPSWIRHKDFLHCSHVLYRIWRCCLNPRGKLDPWGDGLVKKRQALFGLLPSLNMALHTKLSSLIRGDHPPFCVPMCSISQQPKVNHHDKVC